MLPAGECNLYTFPTINTMREPLGETPSKAAMAILRRVLHHLARNTDAFWVADEVGAFPIHALVVGNTPESLELAIELYELCPRLLGQTHVHHRSGLALFNGESVLHILAVNRREQEFTRVVELSRKHLTPKEAKEMFRSSASGTFFKVKPMVNYGGTALSYACVFELPGAVRALLASGHCSLNKGPGPNSGFFPIHSIIAMGSVRMYQMVTAELPSVWRADESLPTQRGNVIKGVLTPLQLAAKLGSLTMFRLILKRQRQIMWSWGPVTQFALNLRGIDSAGEGSGDIMELIAREDAVKRTTEMLLDSFMRGFAYKLFLSKWRRFGRRLHYLRRALDLVLLIGLVILCHALKDMGGTGSTFIPPLISDVNLMYLAGGMLVVMAIILEEELRIAYRFARNEQDTHTATAAESELQRGGSRRGSVAQPEEIFGEEVASKWELLKLSLQFCRLHAAHVQALGLLAAGSACVWILAAPLPSFPQPQPVVPIGADNATVVAADAAGTSDAPAVYDEGVWSYIWILLALAQLFLFTHFAIVIFMPFERLSVMLISIISMARHDITLYLIIFVWAIFAFFEAMFVLYPRSGMNHLPLAKDFNTRASAIFSILTVTLTGDPMDVDFDTFYAYDYTFGMWLAMLLWVGLYLVLIVTFMILLLNLVIAMLTTTFERVNAESTLESRQSFAQCIIKLEIVADSIGMDTHVGEKTDEGEYIYKFRSVEKSISYTDETEGDEGGADPFEDPPPSVQAQMQCSLEAVLRKLDHQHTILVKTAKGDTSWLNDALLGEQAVSRDAGRQPNTALAHEHSAATTLQTIARGRKVRADLTRGRSAPSQVQRARNSKRVLSGGSGPEVAAAAAKKKDAEDSFLLADTKGDGYVDEDGLLDLCRKQMDRAGVQFDEANLRRELLSFRSEPSTPLCLDFEEFLEVYDQIKCIVADSIFNMVNADSTSTTVPIERLAEYLVTLRGVKLDKVQTVLSQIDISGDGLVDREEWRAGFTKGILFGLT